MQAAPGAEATRSPALLCLESLQSLKRLQSLMLSWPVSSTWTLFPLEQSFFPCACRDAEVFAGAGWTWVRAQAAVSDGFAKVTHLFLGISSILGQNFTLYRTYLLISASGQYAALASRRHTDTHRTLALE